MTKKTTLQKLEEERDSLVKVENPGYKPVTYPARKELNKEFYGMIEQSDFTEFLEFLQKVKDQTPSICHNDDEITVYFFETDDVWIVRTKAETLAVQEWEAKKAAYDVYTKRNSELSVAIHTEVVRVSREERIKNAEAALADPDYQKYLALQEVMQAKGYIK